MNLSQLHFSHPLWLWALLFMPLVWSLFLLYYRGQQSLHQIEKFIDKHLIPHLLVKSEHKKKKLWTPLLFWSLVWSCLVLSLAGPRWDFREIATFTRDQNLAILLDLSESMNAKDISPSRLGRAKQKIEDLLNMSKGVKIGLIAFAADPHMIVPMTEDKETIRHLLPSLNTDLVYVQGSKLAPALEMAATMLQNEPGNNKAIVVISDGGFEDSSAIHTAKRLAEKGIILYTIGVGSLEGAPLKDRQGVVVQKNGSPFISKLEKEKFREISKIGHGHYFDADHSEKITLIFEDLEKRSDVQQEAHKTQRSWEEHFYLFLLPVLPFFLWWYRRGYIFALFIVLPTFSQASLSHYFYNSEQQANQTYNHNDFTTAADAFQDPYRKGVAYYRMSDYAAAEKMFRQSTRPEVASSATYNLGNALAQQNKLQEAIAAYEDVLKKWPDHQPAKENLELIKKMLEQQEQQHEEKKDTSQQDNKEPSQKNNSQNPEKSNSEDSESPQNEKNAQEQKPSEQNPERSNSEDSSDKKDSSQSEKNPQEQKTPEQKPEKPKSEDASLSSSENKESSQNEKNTQEQSTENPNSVDSPPNLSETKESSGSAQKPTPRSQEDLDADLWLNQMKNDPQSFLKNKFYLESKKNGTKEEVDPW